MRAGIEEKDIAQRTPMVKKRMTARALKEGMLTPDRDPIAVGEN
jgi:hypothetical protein